MVAQAVHTCRWGVPTLFLPWPLWFDAANNEWSCTRGDRPRAIEDPSTCRRCKGWTAATRATCACGSDPDDHLGSIAP